MAEEQTKGINVINKEASECLLDAIGLVGEKCQLAILMQNEDGELYILANNTSHEALHWFLSKAQYCIVSDIFINPPSEGGEDAGQ